MANDESRVKFKSVKDEVEALEHDPIAQSLVEALESQEPERVDALIEKLTGEGDTGHDQVN